MALLGLGPAGCNVAFEESPDSNLRCSGTVGASIVALEEVTVSGDVTILGYESNAVFANDGVTLSGDLIVDADILSGADVHKIGNTLDLRGAIVEGADRVWADPDTEGATQAAVENQNDVLSVAGRSPIQNGELRLSGTSVLQMPAGIYFFESGMSVSGLSEIVLGGDVKIYVEGAVSINGTTSTNDGLEHKLELISVGTGMIQLSGTSDAHLHVNAPLANVSLSGTTSFDGTVLGKNVGISGTADLGNSGDALTYNMDCEGSGSDSGSGSGSGTDSGAGSGSGNPDVPGGPDVPLPDQPS